VKVIRSITIIVISILISFSASARAGIKLDFNRTNQTYNWLSLVDYNVMRGGLKFESSFNGESNLIKGTGNRWQENAVAKFTSQKSLLSSLGIVNSAQYSVSGLDKRRVRSSIISAGVSYYPYKSIEFRPMVRVERIKRSEFDKLKSDQGMGYALSVSLKTMPLAFLNISSEMSFDDSRLSNIPSNEFSGDASAAAKFRNGDTIWISLKGQEAAKKYYSPTGETNSVIKQIKQERQANFGVILPLPAAMRVHIDGNAHLSRYLYRHDMIDQSTAPQRDNYGRGGGYEVTVQRVSWNILDAIFSYTWNQSNQDYQGILLDLDSEAGEVSFKCSANLSNRDSLEADMVMGVTSYSNPNPGSRQQDRDQQTLVINGRYSHRFSRYFSLGISGGANSFHQIYVSGEWSANNGRNDTYIITPYTLWTPVEWLDIAQIFDIQANYITYDFDRKQHETRNRIFRRASSQTEIRFTLSRTLVWQQTFLYRFEDYGQLIWNDGWQQAVSWDRKKGGFETKLTYIPDRTFRFSPTFAWEKTADYNYSVALDSFGDEPQEIRYLADEQTKLLYGIEFLFDWADTRRLRFDISHRIREFKSHPREINDYATLTLEYLF